MELGFEPNQAGSRVLALNYLTRLDRKVVIIANPILSRYSVPDTVQSVRV